jgi:aspartokinase-like uncharacterized kinase
MKPISVVKVGGSLYDLPDLATRLRDWLAAQATFDVVILPGGGDMADAVRGFHRIHGLDEERGHWLALRALGLNAHFMAWLVGGTVTDDLPGCQAAWAARQCPVLDLYTFARADENRPGRLPYSWRVTSDALAVRVAIVFGAARVVLLKSVTIPAEMNWDEASQRGLVDAAFSGLVSPATGLAVEAVNLRRTTST